MAPQTGTYDISTLLAVRFQSVADFGVDTIRRVLEADIAAHNMIVNEMVSEMAEITSDRQRIYGTSAGGEMVDVDEYGRSATQRASVGSTVGFPLKLKQYAIGWTRKYIETATPADLAIRVQAAQGAHMRAVQTEFKRAIYGSANYTFNDFLIDKVDLAVKRFVNADSASIPNGPNGETFDGATHTHFVPRAGGAVANSDVTSLINNVVEHGHGGQVRIAIARADEATMRALTDFEPYVDPRMIYRASDTAAGTLDMSRLDNRAIGIFGAAEVWVKPWAQQYYWFAWDAGSPLKPLVYRQRAQESLQGLRIVAELDTFPLYAQYMEAEYGLGVWNRTNGAVLYINGAAYTDPTI